MKGRVIEPREWEACVYYNRTYMDGTPVDMNEYTDGKRWFIAKQVALYRANGWKKPFFVQITCMHYDEVDPTSGVIIRSYKVDKPFIPDSSKKLQTIVLNDNTYITVSSQTGNPRKVFRNGKEPIIRKAIVDDKTGEVVFDPENFEY